VFGVQRGGADTGVGVFLEPLHLAAEALVEQESGGARADAVQCLDPGVRAGERRPASTAAGSGTGLQRRRVRLAMSAL